MENTYEEFDVIVVGAGIMGSCSAYQIAKRGKKVLLLEQFDFLHHLGSSHGESRTIRCTYPEDYYADMTIESTKLWEDVESESGDKVYFKTPSFDMGPSDKKSLQEVIATCKSNMIPHKILDSKQVEDEFSGIFQMPENWVGLLTQIGGVLRPTKAVSMFQTLATQNGAVLRDNMEVSEINRDHERGGIRVCSKNGSKFWGKKCLVTVGAWMSKLVETVTGRILPIQPLHTTISYWKIKDGSEEKFSIENGFPTFISYGEPFLYSTPSLEYTGLIKIALHDGYPCDPDKRTWVSTVIGNSLSSWVEEQFSGRIESGEPVLTQSCMYSSTPDGDFVIDFLGGEFGKDVVIGGGFSGHGFKMSPVVGRILTDLVLNGESNHAALKYFRLARFEENPRGNLKEYESDFAATKFAPF